MTKKNFNDGLPRLGKSYLSERLAQVLDAVWLNTDKIRKEANDWDFSLAGRVGRQTG